MGDEDDDARNAQLTPLQLQIKRRETERQAEMRLHSHAYLKQREVIRASPWRRPAAQNGIRTALRGTFWRLETDFCLDHRTLLLSKDASCPMGRL